MTKVKTNNSFTRLKDDKKNKKNFFKLKYFNIFLFVLIIVSGVSHVIVTNNLSIKGFELNEMKKGIRNITSENEELKVKTMSLESFDNLNQRVKELNMVAVGEVAYITNADQAVARK